MVAHKVAPAIAVGCPFVLKPASLTPIGALIIGIIVETSSLFIPADLRFASALAILIIILLVRPQGILGRRERIG